MKKLYMTILFVFLIKYLFSYSYLGTGAGLGDTIGYYGSRNLGMGGVGIASGNDYSVFILNPAAGFNFTKKIGASFAFNYLGQNERVMDTESPASYSSSFTKFRINSFGIYSRPIEYISVGFTFHPIWDLNYISEHYIPENSTEKYGTKYIESKGSIDTYSFGFSVNIKKYGALGFSYSILKGSQKLIQGEDYYENIGLPDIVSIIDYDISGKNINLGLIINTGYQDIYIAGFLRTAIDLEIKYNSKNAEVDIPSQYGLGILIKSLFGYDTFFSFDFIYKNFKDYKYKYSTQTEWQTPAGFRNVYEFHTGVEHNLLFGRTEVPIRFGYYFEPFYGNDAYDRSVFTVGTGLHNYPFNGIKFDAGFEFGKRNFLGDNAYFAQTKFIDETILNFVFEVGYEY
jgi:hypothetical protein